MKFADALAQPGFGAIAEFKRRSPSAGDISPGAQIEDVVSRYENGGARAVSAGSPAGRRSPADGERRLNSAIAPKPGRASASANLMPAPGG